MADHSVHRVSDLAGDERLIVERWLGRALSSEETISVNAYRPHEAPTGEDREVLRRDLIAQAVEIGSRAQGVSEEEASALVDEAIAETRGIRE